jgi:hypothetical protein
MLLNKIPCLDSGYVALLEATCTTPRLNEIAREFFNKEDSSKFLRDLGALTLVIKCPLFVQLHLSTFDLKIVTTPQVGTLEAYIPNVGEINAPNLTDSNDILQSMKATTDALLINPVAYQKDGCDRFTSQVLTPINTYTTVIVQGSYEEWKKFCEQQRLPGPMKAYVKAITQIANVEWR